MELTLCLIYYLLLINVIIIFYNYYFNYLYVYKWNNAKTNNSKKLINTFNVNGCVIIKNMLSTYDCDMLLNIINFQESQQNNKYGDIMSSYNRKDLILPLDYTNYYINKICNKLKVFCNDLVPNTVPSGIILFGNNTESHPNVAYFFKIISPVISSISSSL